MTRRQTNHNCSLVSVETTVAKELTPTRVATDVTRRTWVATKPTRPSQRAESAVGPLVATDHYH